MKRIIIFLIRKRLGLKKLERFKFRNQKSPNNYYYFTSEFLMKCSSHAEERYWTIGLSNVGLNWLLNDECKIIRLERGKEI